MGYNTDYAISIVSGDLDIDEFTSRFEKVTGYNLYGMQLEGVKWYNHRNDMLVLSREYPLVVFIVEGNGEEKGDNWRMYVRNGTTMTVEPVMTWPDVDFFIL